jgi:hypothetical protein
MHFVGRHTPTFNPAFLTALKRPETPVQENDKTDRLANNYIRICGISHAGGIRH